MHRAILIGALGLALIAGACTMCDASIIGAQIFSSRDGRAIDTFRLRRAFTSDEDEKVRATRIIDAPASSTTSSSSTPATTSRSPAASGVPTPRVSGRPFSSVPTLLRSVTV